MPSTPPLPSKTVSPEASAMHSQARKLLEVAGSPELAKHAVNAVSAGATGATNEGLADDRFARSWGFDSYLALMESSLPLGAQGGKNWFLTAVAMGGWILWNNTDFQAVQRASKADAEQQFQNMSSLTDTNDARAT